MSILRENGSSLRSRDTPYCFHRFHLAFFSYALSVLSSFVSFSVLSFLVYFYFLLFSFLFSFSSFVFVLFFLLPFRFVSFFCFYFPSLFFFLFSFFLFFSFSFLFSAITLLIMYLSAGGSLIIIFLPKYIFVLKNLFNSIIFCPPSYGT